MLSLVAAVPLPSVRSLWTAMWLVFIADNLWENSEFRSVGILDVQLSKALLLSVVGYAIAMTVFGFGVDALFVHCISKVPCEPMVFGLWLLFVGYSVVFESAMPQKRPAHIIMAVVMVSWVLAVPFTLVLCLK